MLKVMKDIQEASKTTQKEQGFMTKDKLEEGKGNVSRSRM